MFDAKIEVGIGGTLVLLFFASVYYDVAGGIILAATLLIPYVAFSILMNGRNPPSIFIVAVGSIVAWLAIAAWACRRSISDGVGEIVDSSVDAMSDFFESTYDFIVEWGGAIVISAVVLLFLIGLSVWIHNRWVDSERYRKRAEQKERQRQGSEIMRQQWIEDYWRRKR